LLYRSCTLACNVLDVVKPLRSGDLTPCWGLKTLLYIFSYYSNMSSYSRNSTMNIRTRNRRPRRPKIKRVIENISETKRIAQFSHHFPLLAIGSIAYSDTGIYTSCWTCTNLIQTGTNNNNRIGNTITLKKIKYSFNLFAPTNYPDTVRVLIIHDLCPKGVSPALGEMFEDPTQSFTPIALNSMKHYKILRDVYVDVGGIFLTRNLTFTVSVSRNPTYFGPSNQLSSIETDAIYVIVTSVNNQPATECLQFCSVCSFSDL